MGAPLALTVRRSNTLKLAALDPEAEAQGLSAGMTLASARAQIPDLVAADADPAADLAILTRLREACRRFTPSLAIDPPDGVHLNITGTEPLFGSEAALAADVVCRCRTLGFSARFGVADTPMLAWALARYSPHPIASIGSGLEALAALPIAALRLEEDTLAVLRGLGLRRIGQISEGAVRTALTRRLGETVMERLDQALGRRASPLDIKLEVPPHSASLRLIEPVSDEAQVQRLILRLARPLGQRLESERLGARLFVLELHRVDGAVKRLEVGASRPLRDPLRIAALFAERIATLNEGLEADFGFDLLRLWAKKPQAAASAAQDFLNDDAGVEAGFAALVDRLSARLGEGAVRRLEPVPQTRVPERAVRALPFEADAPAVWADEIEAHDEGTPLRPLTLFAKPQPIEVTAAPLPEGAPGQFQWRRLQRRIVAAEGPERLEPEWGRAGELPLVRDYYRLEDEAGRRYWVFRQGRYGQKHATGEDVVPRWFIHGLFA